MPILRAPVESPQVAGDLPPSIDARHVDYSPCFEGETLNYATVKITHFAGGGCEVLGRTHSVREGMDTGVPCSLESMLCARRRKPLSERLPEDRARAAHRAKTHVRQHVRQIGATTLATFTTREAVNTREALYERWEEFVRRYQRALGSSLDYVAVAERHPSNPDHWHLHVALRGWHSINVARPLWWGVCGGRGMGNIQLSDGGSRIRRLPIAKRSMTIAGYLSKYLVKSFDDEELAEKKRYSRSTFDAASVSVIKLVAVPDVENAWNCEAVHAELRDRLGIDLFEVWKSGTIFLFPGGGGFWFQLASGWSQPPPPF